MAAIAGETLCFWCLCRNWQGDCARDSHEPIQVVLSRSSEVFCPAAANCSRVRVGARCLPTKEIRYLCPLSNEGAHKRHLRRSTRVEQSWKCSGTRSRDMARRSWVFSKLGVKHESRDVPICSVIICSVINLSCTCPHKVGCDVVCWSVINYVDLPSSHLARRRSCICQIAASGPDFLGFLLLPVERIACGDLREAAP